MQPIKFYRVNTLPESLTGVYYITSTGLIAVALSDHSYETYPKVENDLNDSSLPISAEAVTKGINDIYSYIEEQILKVALNNMDKVYPVGSIYISTNNINPSNLFGLGKWELIKDTFLLAAGNDYIAGSTGGEVEHTLSNQELPKTTGQIVMHHAAIGTNINQVSGCFTGSSVVLGKYRQGGTLIDADTVSVGEINFDNGGENQPHNNMPPYLTVYMWKRIE